MKQNNTNTNNLILLITILFFPPIGLVLALLCLYKGNKNWQMCIFGIAYALAIFAYCYEPTVDSDLVRYRQVIEQIQNMSFFDAVNNNLYGEENLYVFMALCWILAKIGQPNLIQAISVFFVFYIAGYINYKVALDFKVSCRDSFASLCFILLNASFYTLTNNVRNIFAFSIIVYAVFRDVYLKKRDVFSIILYVAPCFLHASAILLVLFRLITSITSKMKWLLLVVVVIMKMLVENLSRIFASFGGANILFQLIGNMLNKGNRYYNNYDSAWAISVYNSGSMRLMKILIIIECVIITVFLFRFTKKAKTDTLQTSQRSQILSRVRFIDYLFLIDIMGFACVPMHMPEYWRFFVLIILFNGAVIFNEGFELEKTGIIKLMRYILFAISPFYFLLCIRDLILYSKPLSMLLNSFLCNPIVIFLIGNGLF